jgi:hypothetical protein
MICRPVRLNSYTFEPVFFTLGKARKQLRDDKKIEIERFSLTSSKAFDQVVAAVNAGISHPDMAAFWVHLSYDRMASFLAVYGNRDAIQVAENLDSKIETLLGEAAA